MSSILFKIRYFWWEKLKLKSFDIQEIIAIHNSIKANSYVNVYKYLSITYKLYLFQPKPFRWMLDVIWLNLVELTKLETFSSLLDKVINDK